jgi:cell division septum initiation protein DivIVA
MNMPEWTSNIKELIKQSRSTDQFPTPKLINMASTELSIMEAKLGMRAEQMDRDKRDLAQLRSRIAELEAEVENRTFGKWGIMKRLVEENGQLKNRIAELKADLAAKTETVEDAEQAMIFLQSRLGDRFICEWLKEYGSNHERTSDYIFR